MFQQWSKRSGRALFILVSLCVAGDVRGTQVTSCLPTNAASPARQPPQPTIPDSFRVEVEVSTDTDSTQFMQLVLDGLGNRAVVKSMSGGEETTMLFSYTTQEIFHFEGKACTVKNMNTDPSRFLFYGETMADGIGHVAHGSTALWFGPDIPKVYKGRGHMVRGIEAEMWHTCFSPDNAVHQLSINYYFSVQGWSTPSQFSPAPVRYEVNMTETLANGTVTTSRYTYDLFNFLPDADTDSSAFETPEGVLCPNRKNIKVMPTLDSPFLHVQTETVDLTGGMVTHSELWYDQNQKLVRVEIHNADPDQEDPQSAIHDFAYGVSYQTDRTSGQCKVTALTRESTWDGHVNEVALRVNNSFVMTMKTAQALLSLDSNFTYIGQRYARSALCDVYTSSISTYSPNETVEVYFLADGWWSVPEDSDGHVARGVPFMMKAWMDEGGKTFVYNFFNMETDEPDISAFDVTSCYNASDSLRFRVRFYGSYDGQEERQTRRRAQDSLAQALQVRPLRVSRLQLENDASFLYVTATLLDRTPSLVQFNHLPKAVIETDDDFSWGDVESAAACSDMCVNNAVITCRSFEYCPNERGGTCRISRRHVSDGNVSVVPSTCDLYSRTVNVEGGPELTAIQAFDKLKDAIQGENLYFDVVQQDHNDVTYGAVDAEIVFGRVQEVTLPSLTGQFSYRVEMVNRRHNLAETYDIWYDSVTKLVRLDRRDVTLGPPYYSPFTITSIHDFNTGISYNIDYTRGNCTVTPLAANQSFDSQPVNWTRALATGDLTVLMKTPQQFLHLDKTYTFTGQKTVRGILCDVFESRRTDFSLGSGPEVSLFQYFFQSGSWEYGTDTHDDITTQQPVQLVITDLQANEFIIYNFYDYNDEHTTVGKFNIAPCFSDNQRIDFVLDFNQTYRPYLDSEEWRFKADLQAKLGLLLQVTPLRIQNLRVTYNLDRTYVLATLLDQVAPELHFVEVGTSTKNAHADHVVYDSDSVAGCADICLGRRDFVCNSFDWCPDHTCNLRSSHASASNATDPVSCRHFSRLTDGASSPEPTVEKAFVALKDNVFIGALTVNVDYDDGSGQGPQSISYPAIGVRDDIFRLTPPTESGVADLRNQFQVYRSGSSMSSSALILAGMAVDECATACLGQLSFTCNAFSYCFSTGYCLLNANRPATSPKLLSPALQCDVYSRRYLDSYTQYPGRTLESVGDPEVGARDPEDCARRCTTGAGSPLDTCRSFDFCPSTGHCLLHVRHVLDYDRPLINSSLCSHYSRDYLTDFRKHAQKVVTGHDDAGVEFGVDAQTCALHCVQEPSCQSFEFCDELCRLSSLLPSPQDLTGSNQCDLYTLTANGSAADRGGVDPQGKGSTNSPPDQTSTSSRGQTSTGSSPNQTSTSSRGQTNTGSPPGQTSTSSRGQTSTSSRGQTSTRDQTSTSRPSHGTTPGGTSPSDGCPENQASSGQADDTKARVGIALGMLVLGLALGAALALLVGRLRARRQEDAMELVPRTR
ncbi:uncharacterized protein LOC143294704 isoform X2 [Babylonia areolata]|uniref:uncharacterized protein LOC143294704 isoform X2 n=1 Tax=Babylonia areolata TaxID=304850 RepID=UPI003FD29750